MNDQSLFEAFYKAFLASGRDMGEELKGLSCLYRNWREVSYEQVEEKQAA